MNRRNDLWMWAEACDVLRRAERLQNRFFEPGPAASGARVSWEPPMDVFETGRSLHVVVALPGVAVDRVQVLIHDGVVIISGERALAMPARQAAIHRLEIPHGRFERRLALPQGRYQLRERSLQDGCLTVVLDKLG